MKQSVIVVGSLVGFSAFMAAVYRALTRKVRRRNFIDDYQWPAGLIDRFRARRPKLAPADIRRVEEGLRQFFRAYLSGGRAYVAMPSQVVDDLWHEFILYTRAYKDFCDQAFGAFLHHTPALALAPARRDSNAGLRRIWRACCAEEGVNPRRPERLPLLFALDATLNIANGFHYSTDCKALRDRGLAAPYCGGDFGDSSVDGTTAGLGAESGGGEGGHGHGGQGDGGHGGHGCGGDGGSSCGGGCGGGD
jgi:hypothetical protein